MMKLIDADVRNKKVILRTDFNVPVHKGKIIDNSRILKTLPTIRYLIEQNCKIIIISHFGRPGGRVVREYSLAPLIDELAKLMGDLKIQVKFGVDCIGDAAKQAVLSLNNNEILLMENLRFHKEEEEGNVEFARAIAAYGDIFVNDAFACSHRDHASVTGICNFLPSYSGFLLEEELHQLNKIFSGSYSSRLAILGGAKISTKIQLINNLIEEMKVIVVGGAMSNTFLLAKEYNLGRSLVETQYIDQALQILERAHEKKCEIILPEDVVVAERLDDNVTSRNIKISDIKDKDIICDMGFLTCQRIIQKIEQSNLVVWNGPLGAFEFQTFGVSTHWIARAIAYYTRNQGLNSVIGGGDIGAAIKSVGLIDEFTYYSTGGGAFLEWLEGRVLPGVKALSDNIKLTNTYICR